MAGEDFFELESFEASGARSGTFGIIGETEGDFAGGEATKVGQRLIG